MFMSRCTLLYRVLLQFFSMALTHTGAPYSIIGSMAPLQMVLSASCLSPQFSFADFANVCINVVHLFVVEIICSLKLSLLSIVIPKYLMFLTCCRGFQFRYILTLVISLLFLRVASMTSDFCSLKVILFSFAQFVILFISMLAKFSAS